MPAPAPPPPRAPELAGLPRALPFLGVHDAFSASLAGRVSRHLFLSGFGFAASFYGLPDRGLLSWSDLVAFVHRLRSLLPGHLLLVDMDDGYADDDLAAHVAGLLAAAGAWGIVLEDQARPRGCGHRDGKRLLPLDEARRRLGRVLQARGELVVVARTDAVDPGEVVDRLGAYAAAGADVLLADGLRDLDLLDRLRRDLGRPLAFNQIEGGVSPPSGLAALHARGVRIAIYSTPCLFAAQPAMEAALTRLLARDGLLGGPDSPSTDLSGCVALLEGNLAGVPLPEAGSAGYALDVHARSLGRA